MLLPKKGNSPKHLKMLKSGIRKMEIQEEDWVPFSMEPRGFQPLQSMQNKIRTVRSMGSEDFVFETHLFRIALNILRSDFWDRIASVVASNFC
jgi:hypothetical protein